MRQILKRVQSGYKTPRLLASAFCLLALGTCPCRGSDYKISAMRAGETKAIYSEVNLSGRVFLKLVSPDGVGCARLFWVTWPVRDTISFGRVCGQANFAIPSNWAHWGATLWAFAYVTDIKIQGTSDEQVAKQFPDVRFP